MEMQAGRWRVALGHEAGDALALRARLFRGGGCDRDRFDEGAQHLTVTGPQGVAACARLAVQDPAAARAGYTAQSYDLGRFTETFARLVEVGRIGIAPEVRDPDVPRLLLAAMARLVVTERAAVLYGCGSFPADGSGMARLRGRTAPAAWAPGR